MTITEDSRPILLHVRLLQEWLLTKTGGGTQAGGGSTVVAAGIINAGATNLRLTFGGYTLPPAAGGPQYVVKALPWSTLNNLNLTFAGFQSDGVVLSASKGGVPLNAGDLNGLQLLIEVTQLG